MSTTKKPAIDYSNLRNRRMAEKLAAGVAVDISAFPRDGAYYVLDAFRDGANYCDAKTESWVWSVGKRVRDGVVLASLEPDLYLNPEFECLWLR